MLKTRLTKIALFIFILIGVGTRWCLGLSLRRRTLEKRFQLDPNPTEPTINHTGSWSFKTGFVAVKMPTAKDGSLLLAEIRQEIRHSRSEEHTSELQSLRH